MARSRNIKPGFFVNEQLVELPFETRLLFIGLWTLADREGRVEDRPKRIKMALFPADNVDVDLMLGQLQSAGFLVRYEADDQKCIEIINFAKHQNPHPKEASSVLPGRAAESRVKPRKDTASREKVMTSPASSLIPSSLIPDSLTPADDPPGLDAEAWGRWVEYRKQISKPLKSVSVSAAQRKLAAMGPGQRAAVEQSIANGWQGLFDPKTPASNRPQQTKDDMYQAIRELTQ